MDEQEITSLIVKNTGEIRQRLWNVELELDFAKAVIAQDRDRIEYNGWKFIRELGSGQYYVFSDFGNQILKRDKQILWFDTVFEAYEELRMRGLLK